MFKNLLTVAITLFICWLGVNFYLYHITALDGRSRVHALQDEWSVAPDIVDNIAPQSYARNQVHSSYINALPKEVLFPLGGVPNARIIYCEEDEGWHIERSDRYGFFNPDDAWDKPIEIVLLGDSFAQGACTNHHIRYWYDNLSDNNIVSMGMGGNGTLIEYAGFRELLASKNKPRKIFWLIVSNDITDLTAELKTPSLNRYLTDEHFNQNYFQLNLSKYTENALAVIPDYLKRNEGNIEFSRSQKKPLLPEILSGYYLKLRIEKFQELLSWKKNSLKKESSLNDAEMEKAHLLKLEKNKNLQIMKYIFQKANNEANLASVEISFLFIPSAIDCYNDSFPDHFVEIEKFFDSEGVSHFRGHQILDWASCANLFATKRGGHLNSNGYKRIAELLLENDRKGR